MLREEYDTIIIDNPPVGIVSDGLSIISKADCPIYIFRANYSKRFFTQRIGELMENQNLKSINVVLNGVSYGRGKYGYGYGYGYGQYYGEEEKKSILNSPDVFSENEDFRFKAGSKDGRASVM